MILTLTYIGGPTVLMEMAGLRLLTDPTFDPPGEEYHTPLYTLRKNAGPAIAADSIGPIDAVLLSHDHHFDNLDHNGRTLLKSAKTILTTHTGADRLGTEAQGLAAWESVNLAAPDGGSIRITATPARHGPATGDRGPVIGFVLEHSDSSQGAIYVSGDTVLYEGIAEIAQRFSIHTALLFMGAARVLEVGPAHLTFTASEAAEAAHLFPQAVIIPLHYEGWAHFSESRTDIEQAFTASGAQERLRWLEPGNQFSLELGEGKIR